MSVQSFYIRTFLIFGGLAASLPARAALIRERCNEDLINVRQDADGRNRWALKCGLIDQIDLDYGTSRGLYLTMVRGIAPVTASAPCIPFEKFTWCPLGCFAESETVLFNGSANTLSGAAASGQLTVTTLAADASVTNLHLSEQEIDYFSTGEETRDLVCFEDTTGGSLKVTQTHPMILSDGLIVPASEVTPGSLLLGVAGPREVRSAHACASDGHVWNVRSTSDNPLHNTVVAQGFITGSSRFQNEWASEAYRYMIRRAVMRENG